MIFLKRSGVWTYLRSLDYLGSWLAMQCLLWVPSRTVHLKMTNQTLIGDLPFLCHHYIFGSQDGL